MSFRQISPHMENKTPDLQTPCHTAGGERVVWIHERPPLIGKVLLLPLGLLFLWFPVEAIVSSGIHFTGSAGDWIVGIGTTLSGLMMLQVVFFKGDIRWVEETRTLVFNTGGICKSSCRHSLENAAGLLCVRPGGPFKGSPRLILRRHDGSDEWLAFLGSELEDVAKAISEATGVPVIR